MAAQKLSEGLKIEMGTYSPDDSAMPSYRDVHSREGHSSSDEDWSWKARAEETSVTLALKQQGLDLENRILLTQFSLQGQEFLREQRPGMLWREELGVWDEAQEYEWQVDKTSSVIFMDSRKRKPALI